MSEQPQQPAEMTVQQLHAALDELMASRPDTAGWTVQVPYNRGRPGLGQRTATALSVGFDHDRGRVFLEPAKPLGLVDEELKALARRAEKQAGLIFLLNREAVKVKSLAAGVDSALAETVLKMIASREGGIPSRASTPKKTP